MEEGKKKQEKELSRTKVEGAIRESQEIVPCLISWDDMGVQHAVANTFRSEASPISVKTDYRDKGFCCQRKAVKQAGLKLDSRLALVTILLETEVSRRLSHSSFNFCRVHCRPNTPHLLPWTTFTMSALSIPLYRPPQN